MSADLPPCWSETSLGELIDGFQAGRNLKANGHPALPGEYGVLKISAVTWGHFDPAENKALLPGDKPKPHETVRAGDLLISRANTSELVGAVVRVEEDHPTLMLPDKILRLVVNAQKVDPDFLKYALRTRAVREHFEREATGTSDSMRNLSQPKMCATPIQLAPRGQQRRIVEKIEALTAKSRRAKEALDAVPPLLERFRQSVLAAAFRGDLTKDWREQNPDVEPADQLLARIRQERRARWEQAELEKLRAKGKTPKNDEWKTKYVEPEPVDVEGLPELPAGWCWTTVDSLTTRVSDGVHKTPTYVDSGVPFVTVKNLTAGPGISFEDLNYITSADHAEYVKRTHPERGDVLISKDGTLGVVRLIETDQVFSIFVSVALLKPVLRGFGAYLAFALATPQVQSLLVATGSGLKHIHLTDLRATPIPIPPAAEQAEICRRVIEFSNRIDRLGALTGEWRTSMVQLDQAVLSKAFRGELVVPVADNCAGHAR